MSGELVALMGAHTIGALQNARGRTSFRYESSWRTRPDAIPLSLSMPLISEAHAARVTEHFVWGLLPDNALIIERWAKRFQVSPSNPFALLEEVGGDCAGAIRFVTPSRVPELQSVRAPAVDWLSDAEVGARLRALRRDVSAWHAGDSGHFSLGGAQGKIALFAEGDRFGEPLGQTPSTHILKPDLPDRDGHSINEHCCLMIARELGIPTAHSRVRRFGGEVAIVVERYDRPRVGDAVLRAHQEDICQALGIHPANKYENQGGPGARQIATVLRQTSTRPDDDLVSFVRALALNWLIAGTDAHGKNYSLLLSPGGTTRLAPLYDVASILPYSHQPKKIALAMKIGGKYRVGEIGVHEWSKLSRDVGIDTESVRQTLLEMSAAVPDVAATVVRKTRADGVAHPVLSRLSAGIATRAKRCQRIVANSTW